jgi:hypothetical protein
VFSPAFPRQLTPVHSVNVLSLFNCTDFGGDMVRQNAPVIALDAPLSISQLMFFDGEKNSVLLDVCGTNVPDVPDVVDVVPDELVEVVDEALGEDGPPEQAASVSAQPARARSRIDQVRTALGIGEVYDGHPRNGGCARIVVPAECHRPDYRVDGRRHPLPRPTGGVPCERRRERRRNGGRS